MLKDLIAALEAAPQDAILKHGFHNPHSYRGYYDELAFEPAENVRVSDMLTDAKYALGRTFEGYKGGDFKMNEYTPCWIAVYGCTSDDKIGTMLLELMLSEANFVELPR